MTKETILQELGFTHNESKVYLALLELGCVTAGKVTEKCQLHRANVYDALQKLVEKALVAFIMKDSHKYFQVTNPKNLNLLLEHNQARLNSILPELEMIYSTAKEEKSETSIHIGVKAFQQLIYSLLEYNDEILIYGLPKFAPEKVKYFINHFHNDRMTKGIVMKHIYNENAKERITYLNDLKCTEAKFLPQEFDSTVSTMVCKNTVILTFWEDMKNIKITDPDVANTYRKYFYALYKMAKV